MINKDIVKMIKREAQYSDIEEESKGHWGNVSSKPSDSTKPHEIKPIVINAPQKGSSGDIEEEAKQHWGGSVKKDSPAPSAKTQQVLSPGSATNVDVKRMQEVMQNFANSVAGEYKSYPVSVMGKTEKVSFDPRKTFNDFLVETADKSEIHGFEYSTDPNALQKNQKQPTQLLEMEKVLDGLGRIGKGTSEKQPDGIWDFRTDNALKNIYAFANALLKNVQDFGASLPSMTSLFNQNDLSNLKSIIVQINPDNDDFNKIPQAKLSKAAKITTRLIYKLNEFYSVYHKHILDNPFYKGYIRGESTHPMFTVKPIEKTKETIKQKEEINPNWLDKKLWIKGDAVKIPGQDKTKFTWIPVSALKDINSFKQWMSQRGAWNEDAVNNPNVIKEVIDTLSNHVDEELKKIPSITNVTKPGF